MSHRKFTILPLFGALCLSACSAQQCDPTTANLFSGIGCSVGNGYQQRNQQLQTARDAWHERAQATTNESAALNQSVAETQKSVAQTRTELQAMNSRIGVYRKRLAKASSSKSSAYLAAQKSLANLEQIKNQAAANPTAEQLARVKAAEQETQDAVDLVATR